MRTLRMVCFLLLLLLAGALRGNAQGQLTVKLNNPAARPIYFKMVSAGTGLEVSGETGAAVGTPVAPVAGVAGSITIKYTWNASTPANGAGNVVEVGNGIYAYTPTSGETASLGNLCYTFLAAGIFNYDVNVRVDAWTTDDIGNAHIVTQGTAQGGTLSTITLAAGESATGTIRVGELLLIVSGTGAGQTRVINGYSGSSKIATVGRNFQTAPDNTSVYDVLAYDGPLTDSNLAVTSNGVNGNVSGSVVAITNPVTTTGNVLTATDISGIWNALTSGMTLAGSMGSLLSANINATIASRSTYAGGDTPGTTTLLTRLPSAITLNSGAVTVGGYASGQDPATLVFAGSYLTLPGTATTSGTGEVLTFKQWMALLDAMAGGDNVSTTPVANGTFTVTYYLRGAAHTPGNVVYIGTVSLDANRNQTGRTGKVAQPFPTVN